jgi:transposase
MSTLLPDELWVEIQHLFPVHVPSPKGGRPPVNDRDVLTAIIFMLKTGIRWEDLPTEAFGVSEKTCRRRINDWQELNLWQEMHQCLLSKLRGADLLDWSRVLADTSLVKAPLGGEKSARIPRIAVAAAASMSC